MATVKHAEHPDGSHSIGVELDGRYVPFATLDAARVAQLADSGFYNPEPAPKTSTKGGDK